MVVVALAGSGNICKQILNALQDTPHAAVVLTRSPNPAYTARGITVKVVDYTHDSLVAALQSTGAEVLISTLAPSSAEATDPTKPDIENPYVQPQLALIKAALASGTVKRFVTSAWEASYESNQIMDGYHGKNIVWDAVKKSGLEYTAVRGGAFANYLAHGSPKEDVLDVCFDGLPDIPLVIDISKGTANIPGTGEEPIAMTTTQDIGRFVVKLVELPAGTWPEEAGCAGWVESYNTVVKEIERITGKKLDVKYTPLEELEKMAAAEKDLGKRFGLQAQITLARGFGKPGDLSLNRLTDVKAMGLTEFLERWWGQGN